MQVEVSNEQTKVKLEPSLVEYLEKAATLALEAAGGAPAAEAGIVLVDDAYIRELNRTYRNVDNSTDVLSFAMQENSADEPVILGLEDDSVLGDVFISVETAERQASEYGHSLEREVVYLAVHGLLHLLGHDHLEETDRHRMREKEEEVMAKLNLGREIE